jgi:NAD(P)-dependent dehydrogenase (short-subunit alcohol dehydrogenase family)
MPSFNPQKDIPDLAGKVCVITGANSGLGEAAITALAQHNPNKIYLAARSVSKAKAAIQRIRSTSSAAQSANIEILELDLGSFDSIKSAAARLI